MIVTFQWYDNKIEMGVPLGIVMIALFVIVILSLWGMSRVSSYFNSHQQAAAERPKGAG
jgi:hypothetical protein